MGHICEWATEYIEYACGYEKTMEEIEEGTMSTALGRTRAKVRNWTDEEIEGVFLGTDDLTVRNLFLFVKESSYGGQVQSSEPKATATFNFYVRVRRPNGKPGPNVELQYRDGWESVRLFLNWTQYRVPESALTAYRDDLKAVFGEAIEVSVPEPGVSLRALGEKLEVFERVLLKFRDAIDPGAGG